MKKSSDLFPRILYRNVNTMYTFIVKGKIHSSSEISSIFAAAAEDKLMIQNLQRDCPML